MFQLSCFPKLKATSLIIMAKHIIISDQSFVFISITTLSVESLFNHLLRCLILRFREMSRPGDWHSSTITLKFDRLINSTTAGRPVGDWINFNINITTSILQETCGQLSPNCYHSAGRSGKMAPGPIPADPPRTHASVPLPPRHGGNTQHDKQRVLMHGHQGWNVRRGLCHIYMIYVYIWVVYSFCLFCCLFIIVTTQFVALYKPCKPKPKFR